MPWHDTAAAAAMLAVAAAAAVSALAKQIDSAAR